MPSHPRRVPAPFSAVPLLALALLAASPAAAQPFAGPDLEDPLAARSIAVARGGLDARLRLAGEVVDAAGRPLTGVEAEVTIARFDPAAPQLASEEKRTEVIDGYFQFACEPCLAIEVSFYRAGYHWQKAAVYVEKAAERAQPVERKNLQVVMREVGALPQLRWLRGDLVLGEAGVEEALPVAPEAQGRTAPLAAVAAKSGGTGGSLPAIRLQAGREAGGKIATRAVEGKTAPAPAAPLLDFSGVGGVQRYRPLAREQHQVVYEMREAPADGYGPTLPVEPGSAEVIYFYCKIGELYGRGKAKPATVEEVKGGHQVVAYVEIALNPDGSRNLETLE